jgi:hypothetical protein
MESEKNELEKKVDEKKKDAAAMLANSSRKNKTNNLILLLQASNGDMMRVMHMMMMQRQIPMDKDAAERLADCGHHENAFEAELLRREQEQLEYRYERDEVVQETRH